MAPRPPRVHDGGVWGRARLLPALALGVVVLATGCDFVGAPGTPRVAVIGDSVVHQSEAQIRTNLRPDHRVNVFAYNNAKIHQMRYAARVLAGQGARSMVIALGGPDVVAAASPTPSTDPVPYLRDLVRGIASVPCIALVTVKENGVAPIATPYWTRGARRLNNEMWRLADARANVTVVDWSEVADHHSSWFLGDGLHLNDAGVVGFAATVDHAADCREAAGQAPSPGSP